MQSLIASGSKDTLVKLWDARVGGQALQTLHAHRAPLSSLAWHPNGRWLLSSSRDHIVKVGAALFYTHVGPAGISRSLLHRFPQHAWI